MRERYLVQRAADNLTAQGHQVIVNVTMPSGGNADLVILDPEGSPREIIEGKVAKPFLAIPQLYRYVAEWSQPPDACLLVPGSLVSEELAAACEEAGVRLWPHWGPAAGLRPWTRDRIEANRRLSLAFRQRHGIKRVYRQQLAWGEPG